MLLIAINLIWLILYISLHYICYSEKKKHIICIEFIFLH